MTKSQWSGNLIDKDGNPVGTEVDFLDSLSRQIGISADRFCSVIPDLAPDGELLRLNPKLLTRVG